MMLQNHLPKCTFQVPEHHAIVRCLVFGTRSHRRLAAHSTNLKKVVSAFECLCILEPMLNTWTHDACKPLMLALLRGMLCQISWDHDWPRKNIDDRWWQWGALLQPFPRGELCLTTMGLSKERYNHKAIKAVPHHFCCIVAMFSAWQWVFVEPYWQPQGRPVEGTSTQQVRVWWARPGLKVLKSHPGWRIWWWPFYVILISWP